MRVLIKKWGNSAALRIPAPIFAAAGMKLDQAVDVREEDGRIIVVPAAVPTVDVDALIDGITAENRHGDMDFGGPAGTEFW